MWDELIPGIVKAAHDHRCSHDHGGWVMCGRQKVRVLCELCMAEVLKAQLGKIEAEALQQDDTQSLIAALAHRSELTKAATEMIKMYQTSTDSLDPIYQAAKNYLMDEFNQFVQQERFATDPQVASRLCGHRKDIGGDRVCCLAIGHSGMHTDTIDSWEGVLSQKSIPCGAVHSKMYPKETCVLPEDHEELYHCSVHRVRWMSETVEGNKAQKQLG